MLTIWTALIIQITDGMMKLIEVSQEKFSSNIFPSQTLKYLSSVISDE
jgi:hypothetical protein